MLTRRCPRTIFVSPCFDGDGIVKFRRFPSVIFMGGGWFYSSLWIKGR